MALNVLVIAEQADGGELKKSSREALGLARTLVEKNGGGEVSALLVTASAGEMPQRLAAFGADRVFVVETAECALYQPGVFAAAGKAAVEACQATVVLVPGSALGRAQRTPGRTGSHRLYPGGGEWRCGQRPAPIVRRQDPDAGRLRQIPGNPLPASQRFPGPSG